MGALDRLVFALLHLALPAAHLVTRTAEAPELTARHLRDIERERLLERRPEPDELPHPVVSPTILGRLP